MSMKNTSPHPRHLVILPAISTPQLGQTVAFSLIWCPHSGHFIIAIDVVFYCSLFPLFPLKMTHHLRNRNSRKL